MNLEVVEVEVTAAVKSLQLSPILIQIQLQ